MFYIFHGEDSHSQKEYLAHNLLAKQGDPGLLDLNTTRIEKRISFRDLQQACDATPFLAPIRLVTLQDYFTTHADDDTIKQLKTYLPHLPQTTRLVFFESKKLRSNHAMLKFAAEAENGFVKEFALPDGPVLEKWIQNRAKAKNGVIAPHAVHLLAANIGSNLPLLDNELEKLILYKGDAEITAADVELLSPYLAEANIFDLVDALGNQNEKKAALLLQKKFSEGADPFYLFSMFVRQFRLLIQVKEAAADGSRPPAIAQKLNMHSFVAGKLHQQCQHFSMQQLEQIYQHLLSVDVQVKTGRSDMTTALNLFIAALTTS
ncbi:MAG: DNA polymerase III subunit delta [Chloroflexota bacterium]